MGALPHSHGSPASNLPKKESPVNRDQFGRDPESLSEKLRGRSNLDKQTGFSPLFDAVLADLPRLSSGHVCDMLVLVINMLSYGRYRDQGPRHVATLPVSTQELSEYCRCSVRDVQRQLVELESRGMIACKLVRNGAVKYAISLLYARWRELEDYAVWKRRQVVDIDSVSDDDEPDDTEPLEISREAVELFKRPAAVRPGRASRPARVTVGVREVVCQNDSATVDAAFTAVVQSGRLIVCASLKTGEQVAKGEDKGNAERHTRRLIPPNEGSSKKRSKSESNPLKCKIASLFDPILQRCGARLLSPDQTALDKACAEIGAMSYEYLESFMFQRDASVLGGCRAERAIKAPIHVVAIIREARQNWEAAQIAWRGRLLEMAPAVQVEQCELILASTDPDWSPADKEWARQRIEKLRARHLLR